MDMKIEEILEYAQLAQQCYCISNSAYHLPDNWQLVFAPKNQGNWDTFYALYANQVKKEVVLAIRGSDKLFNILTDVGLVVSALTGKYQRPPHQDIPECLLKQIHGVSLKSTKELEDSIRDFDDTVGTETNGWVTALTYISAVSAGLCATNTFACPIAVIPYLALGTVGFTAASLIELNNKAFKTLITRLESREFRNIIFNLEKSIQHHTDANFPNFKLKIVGHSLGAVMAELCAVKIGVECISFESPGTSKLLDTLAQYKDKPRIITNFLSAPNLINTLNTHSGNIFRLKLPHTDGSYSFVHGTSCVLSSAGLALTYGSVFTGVGVFLSAFAVGALNSIPQLWRETKWLLYQHSIDNIVMYLEQDNPQLIEMWSWPKIFWKRKRNLINNSLRNFLPLQKDKPGLRNLLNEEGMREAQIKKMEGYNEILRNRNCSINENGCECDQCGETIYPIEAEERNPFINPRILEYEYDLNDVMVDPNKAHKQDLCEKCVFYGKSCIEVTEIEMILRSFVSNPTEFDDKVDYYEDFYEDNWFASCNKNK